MRKAEFLKELEKRLQGLPKDEIESRLAFYSEMIDDRIEDGKTEEEAVEDLGGTDEVVRKIVSETKIVSLVKNRIKPKRSISGFEILLLILGFPLWFPLLMVVLSLTFVAFILLWVFVIVSYAIEVGIIGTSLLGFMKFGIEFVSNGNFNTGYLAIGVLGAGIALLFIFICGLATKSSFKATKGVLFSIKNRLIGGKKNENN